MGAYVNVNYPVVIRHGEEGCHAHVPTFEINVKGTDIDEAMEMAQAVIEMTAQFMFDDHELVPGPVNDSMIPLEQGEELRHIVASVPKWID